MDLQVYAETELPTVYGVFRVVVFRETAQELAAAPLEHLAIIAGDVKDKKSVLTRVHSECLTAEVLGSLKCDCREQLSRSLEKVSETGTGVVVYLRQEGRGIGLGNKIRAYALQDKGADTVEANIALGFEADARSYEIPSQILKELGIQSVRLMTNNPDKISGLRDAGIPVDTRIPHWFGKNPHNASYLDAKRKKMGHHADVTGDTAEG